MEGRVRRIAAAGAVLVMLLLCLLYAGSAVDDPHRGIQSDVTDGSPQQGTQPGVTAGTEVYQGFLMDNVLHAGMRGCAFSYLCSDSYDGSEPYPLFFTMSGYGGMYFRSGGKSYGRAFRPVGKTAVFGYDHRGAADGGLRVLCGSGAGSDGLSAVGIPGG